MLQGALHVGCISLQGMLHICCMQTKCRCMVCLPGTLHYVCTLHDTRVRCNVHLMVYCMVCGMVCGMVCCTVCCKVCYMVCCMVRLRACYAFCMQHHWIEGVWGVVLGGVASQDRGVFGVSMVAPPRRFCTGQGQGTAQRATPPLVALDRLSIQGWLFSYS